MKNLGAKVFDQIKDQAWQPVHEQMSIEVWEPVLVGVCDQICDEVWNLFWLDGMGGSGEMH